jgi:glycine/D-amino acid oxidase-like deaminating enzyme
MSEAYEVIVVGGGVIGAAIFHRLSATLGGKVLLVEKSRFGQGSTGWSGGILRCFHHDPLLADMACEGDRYFRHFEQHTGHAEAFRQCGFLHFIYPQQEAHARLQIERLSGRTEIAWLSAEEAGRRFPEILWDDLAGAVYEPNAGYMDPVAVSRAWIAAARTRGAVAHEGVQFEQLLMEGGKVAGIETNLGQFRAPCVVMCVGAWTEKLAQSASIEPPRPVASKAIQLNVFYSQGDAGNNPAYADAVQGIYGRADGGGQIYLGCPVPEWHIDPDLPAVPEQAHQEHSRQLGRRRFRWMDGARSGGGFRRFDAYTADERGVAARSQVSPGLVWATGFSGGGFKLAPSIALQICDLVQGAAVAPGMTDGHDAAGK